MAIGVMLRHLKRQQGGIGTYTRSLLAEILRIDTANKYLFMYADHDLLGSYAAFPNVEETVIASPSALIWDQLLVPRVIAKRGLGIVFNPKLSVPLLAGTRKIFVLHGADWFVYPQNYTLPDRMYHRVFAPLYCHNADAIISVSKNATGEIVRRLGLTPSKVKTIYHGVDQRFRPIKDKHLLETIRQRYGLPEHFVLFVGQIYPMKNVGRTIAAFAHLHKKMASHKLVLVGKPSLKYQRELALVDKHNLQDDVLLTGWVPDSDLPSFYNLADLFVFPSLYEGFGIPLLEAMACGCPIVTSDRGACPEVVGDAALIVDPESTTNIAAGMEEALTNRKMREDLIQRGLHRVKDFSWERCARETLDVIETVTTPERLPERHPTQG